MNKELLNYSKCFIFSIVIILLLQGCVKKDKLLLHYDDGSAEEQRELRDSGHAVRFKAPRGEYGIESVRFWGIRQGAGQGLDHEIVLSICDEDMKQLEEVRVPHGMVDTNTAKWRVINVEPPLYCPKEFWVILDTNSSIKDGIFVGIDNDNVKASHSKTARPGHTPMDLPGAFEWLIRVQLVPWEEVAQPE